MIKASSDKNFHKFSASKFDFPLEWTYEPETSDPRCELPSALPNSPVDELREKTIHL